MNQIKEATCAFQLDSGTLVMNVGKSIGNSYTDSSDDLKRSEQVGSSITTLVWDGRDYLQGRS